MSNFLRTAGIQSMLKEGHRVFDDPVLKNIEACRELTKITRTSLGPDGLSKLIINHLGKTFVTHDAHTIMSEMEVQHPAAKLLAMAAAAMNEEIGDGTNLVLCLAGELLSYSESLITKGLHTSDIIAGFERASASAIEFLPKLKVTELADVRDAKQVASGIRTAIMSKSPHFYEHLTNLVTDACLNSLPETAANFCVDDVRTIKIEGMSVGSSEVVHGFLIGRDAEGVVKSVTNAKTVVYQCAIDNPNVETKGMVIIDSAEALKAVSKSEETQIEAHVKALSGLGVKLVVSSSAFGDLAMHFLDAAGIMAVRIMSKHDLRRFASAAGAQVLSTLIVPSQEDLGVVDEASVEEYAGKKSVVFRQKSSHSRISSIVLRGPTAATLDDAERAVHDGINAFRSLARHPALCAGGGAAELEIARHVKELVKDARGLDQYSIDVFADSFLVVAKTLAEVSGKDGNATVADLQARASSGKAHPGFSVFAGGVVDDVTAGPEPLLDLLVAKEWAIRLAVDAVINVLRTDQIIMAKQAGGPRMQSQRDED